MRGAEAGSPVEEFLAELDAIPEELAEQWIWFRAGRWPAGYAWIDRDGRPGPLLVL